MRRNKPVLFFVVSLTLLCEVTVRGAWRYDANPGEDVRINCSTGSLSSVDWQYRHTEKDNQVSIYIGNSAGGGGSISIDYRPRTRYQVLEEKQTGRYDLRIRNVTKTDEGTYLCTHAINQDVLQNTTVVVSGEKAEVCSNDVSADLRGIVQLSFPSTRTNGIHLEHRAIGQQYLLYVYRDGNIMNDYYVRSGRFSVNVSSGSWNLIIRDTQMTDSGTYVCSEESGTGTQYEKELVVVDRNVHVDANKMCNSGVLQVNVTCAANFTGNCPPRLKMRVSQAEDKSTGELEIVHGSVTTYGPSASLEATVMMKESQHLSEISCLLATSSSYIDLGNKVKVSACETDEYTSRKAIVIIIVTLISIFILTALSIVILMIWRRRRMDRNENARLASSKLSMERETQPLPVEEKMEDVPLTTQA